MRLLVVEDDPRLARLIARGLREEAYAVDVCENGSDAIVQAVVNTYDAIILDVMLPGIDGFGVVSTLRARNVRTPVLMLTSRDAVADRIAGLDRGADDYLTKPFDFGELLARLRALAGMCRPHTDQTEGGPAGTFLKEFSAGRHDARRGFWKALTITQSLP